MPKKSDRGYLRIYKDKDSETGFSAAVLIQNLRPKKTRSGYYHIAKTEFNANFVMNCEGFKLRPKVEVRVWCDMPKHMVDDLNKRKRMERALAGSPMLF